MNEAQPNAMTRARTQGAHHIGLTVPSLAAARAFFIDVLGFEPVGEVPDYPAAFVSDGVLMITLWQVQDPDSAVAFDRRHNIGLHHLALRVADDAALDALHETLVTSASAQVEFPPEALGGGQVRHMMCRIPGDIRLEFIAA